MVPKMWTFDMTDTQCGWSKSQGGSTAAAPMFGLMAMFGQCVSVSWTVLGIVCVSRRSNMLGKL